MVPQTGTHQSVSILRSCLSIGLEELELWVDAHAAKRTLYLAPQDVTMHGRMLQRQDGAAEAATKQAVVICLANQLLGIRKLP